MVNDIGQHQVLASTDDLHAVQKDHTAAAALYRLYAAIEHYRRMGWLTLPAGEQWKYDDLVTEIRDALQMPADTTKSETGT